MYTIKRKMSYYEIIDAWGQFVCSADTLKEAEDEITEHEKDLF